MGGGFLFCGLSRMSLDDRIYKADLLAGSLMLRDSREIARLLLDGAAEAAWYQALVVDNVLQKKSPASARRIASLIRTRLEPMGEDLWRLVCDGSREVALQALFAAAIRHSRLLGDFLSQVVREHHRTFKSQLPLSRWRFFLEECENHDPMVANWSESTRNKLGQVVSKILVEAGYLESARSRTLSPIRVHPSVKDCLLQHGMDHTLDCMEIDR